MSQTVTLTERPQTFCVLPEQKKADEGSLFGTLAKATLLGAIGYGLYSLGARNAADKAGEKFEEFVTRFSNMDTFDREEFVQNVRDLGNPVFSSFSNLSNSTLEALQPFREQAVTFGGNLQKMFSENVMESLSTPNLGVQDSVDAARDAVYDVMLTGLAQISFLGSLYVGIKKNGLI